MKVEYIKLIGIVIIVLGFAFKFDVLATVLIAGLVTGLVSGLDFVQILEIIGKSFVDNRLMSIFLIIFPVIAVIERYGLKERAAYLIGRIKKASSGKVLTLYMIIRSIASGLNIRLGGHVEFVRPLIYPMAEAAEEKNKGSKLTEKERDHLKGMAASTENYGNFFVQNLFPMAAGAMLIAGTLFDSGFKEVTIFTIAEASIPVAVISVILTIISVLYHDYRVKKAGGK